MPLLERRATRRRDYRIVHVAQSVSTIHEVMSQPAIAAIIPGSPKSTAAGSSPRAACSLKRATLAASALASMPMRRL